jgi:uncharacterized damage-inducible protein DinB
MSTREYFTKRFEAEQPAFVRVLRALPGDRLDYKPHERSTGAGELAWQLVNEQRALAGLTANGDVIYETPARPESIDAIVAAYEAETDRLRKLLATMDDARWSGPAHFVIGGQSAWDDTVEEMFWGFLVDMIHHRGQLSAYIRPMGGKVPQIYGPSGDDQG